MSHSWQEDVQAAVRAGGRISDRFIVDKVRTAVLNQRLPPGTRLPEVALGEIFGVSRSVVRKALTRLAADHVVSQQPNQVARVRAPSIEETRETFAARRLVEGEVAALLAGRLDAELLATIDMLVEKEAGAHARGDEAARIEHSLAIHHLLAEHSPNRVLGAMLTDLVLRTSIVIALYKRAGLASCYLAEDHPALLNHLRAGDGEAARRCIHDHLQALEGLLDLSTRETRIDLMAILGQRESATP
ncbi:GntR family transcriptional regulator [Billgrantia kenyensis]|uniref:GntR family transcriptional regulator n=1 Tax=Billgrantia kenyensis TaxID=321266 RepID=A0A7V9VZN2_9GAMM|nr:GntR family transcriptional regulator [Halomonas kenyensis]MBA2778277.1 GntR family transcriptional regulator [Halomonas kenyensis]MCG6660584.1 GntR family transcriptional regulator [Halomonas kenyensis]